MSASTSSFAQRYSWRRRLKHVALLHLKQIPCLTGVIGGLRCWRRRRYQTLGQDEEGDGTEPEDQRQSVNHTMGEIMMKLATLAMIAITAMLLIRSYYDKGEDWESGLSQEEFDQLEFKRDSPLILYMAAIELLICGACAHTAAMLYRRSGHSLRHPSESPTRLGCIKVTLQKAAGLEDQQYGLCFRPSSDGLECLIVEAVRKGSLLDLWNQRGSDLSPEELVEQALGDEGEEPSCSTGGPAQSSQSSSPRRQGKVLPGSVIVAINEVSADVGMMQLQLTKPKVTLWVRNELFHLSQMGTEVLGPEIPASDVQYIGVQSSGEVQHAPVTGVSAGTGDGTVVTGMPVGGPAPTFLGRVGGDSWDAPSQPTIGGLPTLSQANPGPKCACMGLEDEEAQILMRWTVCGIVFGWVTMIPVLLMQPHEERPRQQLFRRFLLKPCILVLPIWLLLWILDCVEIIFMVKLVHPFWYFLACHVILPAVLVWYLMQMQFADEQLILDQRKARLAEAGSLPLVMEDPSPLFLKELIAVNPVVLVWLGACAAIPLVMSSLLTPMSTARGKMAQGFVNLIYAPFVLLQLASLYVLYYIKFMDLPKLYIFGFGLLLSVPCFLIWCFCLVCASRYSRQDVALVERQRLQRARELSSRSQLSLPVVNRPDDSLQIELADPTLVDTSEAIFRESELVFTA